MSTIAVAPDADAIALVRGAAGSVVLVIAPGRSAVDQAMLIAAIGPLAVERAPGARVNAVTVGPGAAAPAVAAAVAYLAGATSVTGQVLAID